MSITKINKETFWQILKDARTASGYDLDAYRQNLHTTLRTLHPNEILRFQMYLRGYVFLAKKYGLWTAAIVMRRGSCSDDGFIDFRCWLIAQGKHAYMSALRNPNSLVNIEAYEGCKFEGLMYIARRVYEEVTGESSYDRSDPEDFNQLIEKLGEDIMYGDGIDYPYKWNEAVVYLRELCIKYMDEQYLGHLILHHNDSWNTNNSDILEARLGNCPADPERC